MNKSQCYVLAVAIQKGGTGKTATAAALAEAAREDGKRVLMVDLDPQGNLTFAAGAPPTGSGSYELIIGSVPAEELIINTDAGDLIPASWSLATITTAQGSARRLSNALKSIKDRYDVIFIDTPPTIGELQFNAFQAADGVIVPIEADVYGLQGLHQIVMTIHQASKASATPATGVIITKYDGRSTLARQMLGNIERFADGLNIPVLGTVRKAVCVAEAAALQKPLLEYAPKSKPAQDYRALYKTLKEVLSW